MFAFQLMTSSGTRIAGGDTSGAWFINGAAQISTTP